MYSEVFSVAITGIDAVIVSVETDSSNGIPYFEMSGYLAAQVRESKERIKVAIKNSGVELSPKRIVINISPADIRKDGTGFDLPIAIGILAANNIIKSDILKNCVVIGELSLDGTVNGVRGVLAGVIKAKEEGYKLCIVPNDNLCEASLVDGIQVLGARSLYEVIEFFAGNEAILQKADNKSKEQKNVEEVLDFAHICGQDSAKRATLVAACGMHNIIYVGSPGSGKTMLAKRIPGIMSRVSYEEALLLTKIYSVAGELKEQKIINKRPFRNPHHSITSAAMLGGGSMPRPGEVTLASGGVLFLDEMTQYPPKLLESLRQPIEDRSINICRLGKNYVFPADFMLVAAMNPCSCGYYPDRNRCNCTEHDVARFIGKISQPIWDRFDINIRVNSINFEELNSNNNRIDNKDNKYTTFNMSQIVTKVKKIQEDRFKDDNISFNSQMDARLIKKYCQLGENEKKLLELAYNKLGLTARGYSKILKVARTIADIDESKNITSSHISEAVSYRNSYIR